MPLKQLIMFCASVAEEESIAQFYFSVYLWPALRFVGRRNLKKTWPRDICCYVVWISLCGYRLS